MVLMRKLQAMAVHTPCPTGALLTACMPFVPDIAATTDLWAGVPWGKSQGKQHEEAVRGG